MTTASTIHEQVIRVCGDIRAHARFDSIASDVTASGATIDLSIHDPSRLEWTAVVPLDTPNYELEVELEIPSSAAAMPRPWANLQSLARLEATEANLLPDDGTIDALRRHAVSVASRLAWSSAGFTRHCERIKGFAGGDEPELPPDAGRMLMLWLDAGLARFVPTRLELSPPQAPLEHASLGSDASNESNASDASDASRPNPMARERALVDEYWSAQLVHMLTGAAQALRDVRAARGARAMRNDVEQALRPVEDRVFDTLVRETRYRRENGYIDIEDGTMESLERYIERSSLLKKHFQESLFLEPDSYQVHDRVHTWVSSLVAVVAGMWAFVWQLVLLHGNSATVSRVTWGLFIVSVFAGCIYATRERIKEAGRAWIEGRVHRFYAHRVARYRAPFRMLPHRNVIVNARESFDQTDIARADAAGSDALVRLPHTVLRFVHRGKLQSVAAAKGLGATAVRELFRFDLSPIFLRLHDDVKPVARLDAERRTVLLADAPRFYRLRARVKLTTGSTSNAPASSSPASNENIREMNAIVVVSKKGLVRIERRSGGTIL